MSTDTHVCHKRDHGFHYHYKAFPSLTSSTPPDYDPQYDAKSCLGDPGGRRHIQKVRLDLVPEVRHYEIPVDTKFKSINIPGSGRKGTWPADRSKWNKFMKQSYKIWLDDRLRHKSDDEDAKTKAKVLEKEMKFRCSLKPCDEPSRILREDPPNSPNPLICYVNVVEIRVFVLDSGCPTHRISSQVLTRKERTIIFKLDEPLFSETANGTLCLDQGINLYVPQLDDTLMFRVPNGRSPTLISVGDLCTNYGYKCS